MVLRDENPNTDEMAHGDWLPAYFYVLLFVGMLLSGAKALMELFHLGGPQINRVTSFTMLVFSIIVLLILIPIYRRQRLGRTRS